ncbi:MAG: hypothetical protein H0U54_13765 [Acidobacteria bacterium]|jgi:hypothetical protein|nr:hypothetical protein [Acidobacteriota bacterium]
MNTFELAKRLDEEGFNSHFYCVGPGWHRGHSWWNLWSALSYLSLQKQLAIERNAAI